LAQIWTFITENWSTIAGVAVAIGGVTVFLTNLYTMRKLRLEIKKLKKELDEKKTSPISVAKLDEIIRITSSRRDLKRLRTLLMDKSLHEEDIANSQLTEEQVSEYSKALDVIEIDWVTWSYPLTHFFFPIYAVLLSALSVFVENRIPTVLTCLGTFLFVVLIYVTIRRLETKKNTK
jgi:hypothetical protein